MKALEEKGINYRSYEENMEKKYGHVFSWKEGRSITRYAPEHLNSKQSYEQTTPLQLNIINNVTPEKISISLT